MWSWMRRVVCLAVLAAAGYAAYVYWQRRSERPSAAAPPVWPPLTDTSTAPTEPPPEPESWVAAPGDPPPTWLRPLADGACPDGYPVKVNVKSGIYHVPGGRFYARTVPERCYSNEAAAEADGYRRAKT